MDFEVTAAHEVLMDVGETVSAIHVVLKGECAIYTMRPNPRAATTTAASSPGVDGSKASSDDGVKTSETTDLRSKFQAMQRRASVSIRSEPLSNPETGEVSPRMTTSQRRQSIAMAVVATDVLQQQQSQAVAKPPQQQMMMQRRESVALRRASFAVAPAMPQQQNNGPHSQLADGSMFPIQMTFAEGDSLGVQRAIHNSDPALVQKEGYQYADHTVIALSQLTTMVFTEAEHVELVEVRAAKRASETKRSSSFSTFFMTRKRKGQRRRDDLLIQARDRQTDRQER